MQINAVLEVMSFTVKIEKFVGGNLSHFWCLACGVGYFLGVCLIQVSL